MKKFISLFIALALIVTLSRLVQVSAATIKINKTKATIEIDSTLKLKVTGTISKVTWKSSKSSIASVNNSGIVTAKKIGKTNITATANSKRITCIITVIDKKKISTIADVVSALKRQGLLTGEETEAYAAMIGGTNGIKYLDSNVDLYEFDKNSDVYKQLVKTKKVSLIGFNMDLNVSAINGKFILMCDDAKNKDEIIHAFLKLNIE